MCYSKNEKSKVLWHGAVTISIVKIYSFLFMSNQRERMSNTSEYCPCKPSKQTTHYTVVVVVVVAAYSYTVCRHNIVLSVYICMYVSMIIGFMSVMCIGGLIIVIFTHPRYARTACTHTKGFEYSIFFFIWFGSVPFPKYHAFFNVYKCNRVMPYKHIKRK